MEVRSDERPDRLKVRELQQAPLWDEGLDPVPLLGKQAALAAGEKQDIAIVKVRQGDWKKPMLKQFWYLERVK